MDEIRALEYPTKAIVHLKEDEDRAAATLTRITLYQVTLPVDESSYSPSGDFVRLNFTQEDGEPANELHGWFQVESIIVDEYLEQFVEEEWKEISNG